MSKLSQIIQDGHHYMKRWPKQRVLAPIFPEARVISATQLAIKTMPAIAVATVMLPYLTSMTSLLPQAMMMAMVIFFMPVHGLYWLGQRANAPLPRGLANWYRELHQKLTDVGESLAPAATQPRYIELAEMLNRAFARFDRSFVNEHPH